MSKYQKGKIIQCTINGIEKYGAFVSLDEYYSGLIHVSEISNDFVKNIEDYLHLGQTIYAEILDIDEDLHHLKLSIKNINYKNNNNSKNRVIKETRSGFKTLAYKLPIWIDESLKKMQNTQN